MPVDLRASPKQKALDSRYLKRATIKDALGNILDTVSFRVIKAVRFPALEVKLEN